MQLCRYSKSEILSHLILPECPLGLNANRAKKCECKKRVSHVTSHDLRVTTCTWPRDWRGVPVSRVNNIQKVEFDMSTAEATEVKQTALFGEVNNIPLKIPVIGLCGAKGSGKTLAGLLLDPENTVVIDVEDSSVTYNVPIKRRASLYDEAGTKSKNGIPTPLECWEWFASEVETLECRVLFVDPITDLQAGLVEWVKANPEKFGRSKAQYEKASGLLWADVKSYLKMFLGRLSRRVEAFVFTAHMGSVWSGGSPVAGKQKAKGVDTFYELASLYLYLQRDADPKTGKVPKLPVASITPPLGKSRLAHMMKAADGTYEAVPILPPRMKDFDWNLLRKYVANPPDYAKLAKDQLAESNELTDDEKLLIRADIAANEREAEELRNGRLDAMAAAAKANKEARAAVATDATRTEANESSKDEPKDTVPPKEGPSSTTETAPLEPDPADLPLSDADRVEIIKQQFKDRMFSKEQMIAAIQKHGGPGAKLAGLTSKQLIALQGENWTALTKKDLEAGK